MDCSVKVDLGPLWSSVFIGSWVLELTIVIFSVEGGSSGIGDEKELINVLLISEVLVEVVLEVLDLVHVLLDEIVSSDSWEGESVVVHLPGGGLHLWVLTLLLELSVDVHSGGIVSLVELG